MGPPLSLFLSLPLSTLLPRNPSMFTFVSIDQTKNHPRPAAGGAGKGTEHHPLHSGLLSLTHSSSPFLFLPPLIPLQFLFLFLPASSYPPTCLHVLSHSL